MNELSFGEWLSRQRKSLGLTQKQLAERINCATITVRKIEAEQRHPSLQIVEQLMKVLNIPPFEHDAFLRYAHGDEQSITYSSLGNLPWHTSIGSFHTNRSFNLASILEYEPHLLLGSGDSKISRTHLIPFNGLPRLQKPSAGFTSVYELFPHPHTAAYIMVLVPTEIADQVIPYIAQSPRDGVPLNNLTPGLPTDPIAIYGVYIAAVNNIHSPRSGAR